LLLTILGEFVLPHGGVVWTSTIVRSLGVLRVEERNARQAVSRLADQGIVGVEKQGRRARWHLTEHGHQMLTAGTERIYRFGAGGDAWDGRWSVVLCSVPEEQRAQRHQLRTRLEFAGFGFLAPGVAISPHVDREHVASDVLQALRLAPAAVVLRAETVGAVPDEDLLRRAWDLRSLGAGYDEFIASFERRAPGSDEACFADLVELVHAWRRFPFVDPEIPARLLPTAWPGRTAKALFDAKHAVWTVGANAWFDAVDHQYSTNP